MVKETNLIDLERSLQVVRRLSSFCWAIVQAARFIRQTNLKLEDLLFIIDEESQIHVCNLVIGPFASDTNISRCLHYLKASLSAKALSCHEKDPITATLATSYSDRYAFSEQTGNLLRLLSYIDKNGISSGTFVEGTHALIFVPGMFPAEKSDFEFNWDANRDAIGCAGRRNQSTIRTRSKDLVDVQDLFLSIDTFLTIAKSRREGELNAKDPKTRSATAKLGFLRFKQGRTDLLRYIILEHLSTNEKGPERRTRRPFSLQQIWLLHTNNRRTIRKLKNSLTSHGKQERSSLAEHPQTYCQPTFWRQYSSSREKFMTQRNSILKSWVTARRIQRTTCAHTLLFKVLPCCAKRWGAWLNQRRITRGL